MLNFLKMKRNDACLYGHWKILKPYPIHKRYFASLVDADVLTIKQNRLMKSLYSNKRPRHNRSQSSTLRHFFVENNFHVLAFVSENF